MKHATVVFVCTGNTCRSPLAMVLARLRWPAGVEFLSAGLQAEAGRPAAENARLVAAERGGSLADFEARRLDAQLVARADWFVGMTRSHVAQLNARLGAQAGVRVGLLGHPNCNLFGTGTPVEEEVADPIGGSLATYRTVADQLERLLAAWAESFTGASAAEGERT